MPNCINCGAIKTKLDRNNVCSQCRENDTSNENNLVDDTNEDIIDTNKPLSDLTTGDLINIITKALNPLNRKIASIERNIKKIGDDAEKVETELETLKSVIIEQQKSIDYL